MPEFKLAGRADVLTDETLEQKLDDLFWELIEWRPRPTRTTSSSSPSEPPG